MDLSALVNLIDKKLKPVKIAIAVAEDKYLLEAVLDAYNSGHILPLLVGNRVEIESIIQSLVKNPAKFRIIDVKDETKACQKAIELIKNNEADILCKGLVSTQILMREVLRKENHMLRTPLLSHLAIFHSPYYHKYLGITDAALNISPGIEEKKIIASNAIEVFHKLQVSTPKVAFLSATEVVNPKIHSTLEAEELKIWFTKNRKDCIADGPLALDNAISKDAAHHKKIVSKVAGEADILVVPNIESGNILYKSLNFMGGAVSASVILGAIKPVMLTSRSDSAQTKFNSIALAAAIL